MTIKVLFCRSTQEAHYFTSSCSLSPSPCHWSQLFEVITDCIKCIIVNILFVSLFFFIFPNFIRYWNYLRKQTFVLESYISRVNWFMNRALFSSHCYLSWSFVAPYFMSVIHMTAALRSHFIEAPIKSEIPLGGEFLTFHCFVLVGGQSVMWLQQGMKFFFNFTKTVIKRTFLIMLLLESHGSSFLQAWCWWLA